MIAILFQVDDDRKARDQLDYVFRKLDINQDGVITLEEFIESCLKVNNNPDISEHNQRFYWLSSSIYHRNMLRNIYSIFINTGYYHELPGTYFEWKGSKVSFLLWKVHLRVITN